MDKDDLMTQDKKLGWRSRKAKRLMGAACLLTGLIIFSLFYMDVLKIMRFRVGVLEALTLFIVMFGCSSVGIGLLAASFVPDRTDTSE